MWEISVVWDNTLGLNHYYVFKAITIDKGNENGVYKLRLTVISSSFLKFWLLLILEYLAAKPITAFSRYIGLLSTVALPFVKYFSSDFQIDRVGHVTLSLAT